MFLIAVVLVATLAVPAVGGRLLSLAEVRFRGGWLAVTALAIQLLTFTALPGPRTTQRQALYVTSYLLGVGFLMLNRRLPGVWLIALGAGLNLAAMVANGGVMPAAPSAVATAGLPPSPTVFSNSIVLSAPRLALLGDNFAIPKGLPLHNVFSLGDLFIAVGLMVAIHRLSGSRLMPSGRGQFAPLLRHRSFARVWVAQAVSNLGDWTYSLAVAATLAAKTKDPRVLAFLLIAQAAPAALFGMILSPVVDRHSRKMLMVGADVVRAIAILSLMIGGSPSPGHIYLVAACLGLCGALFQPSLQASVPNLVPEDRLVAANSLISSTFHIAIVVGPALGGFLVAQFGQQPVFAMNAASFVISALLIAGVRIPRPRVKKELGSPVRALFEGMRYAAMTPLVRGVIIVTVLIMLAASTKAPLESLFVLQTLSLGTQALGLVAGTWGVGMLLGSVAAPALTRRWPREGLFALSIATAGTAVLVASRAGGLSTVLLAWLIAGMANSVGNVSYSSLLQERTPDGLRGRVFAASEAALDAAYLTGAFLAGWLGVHLGIRNAYAFSGGLLLVAALTARSLLLSRTSGTAFGFATERPVDRIEAFTIESERIETPVEPPPAVVLLDIELPEDGMDRGEAKPPPPMVAPEPPPRPPDLPAREEPVRSVASVASVASVVATAPPPPAKPAPSVRFRIDSVVTKVFRGDIGRGRG